MISIPHTLMFFIFGLLPGTAEALTLAAADWAPPRRAETLATHRPLADFVRTFDQRDDSRDGRGSPRREPAIGARLLRIRHAGGEPDSRFAEQLRDALVALGVPAARIRLVPAAAEADRLILELSVNGETGP